MNQELAIDWQVFGYSLALAFAFGALYAWFVRYLSKQGVEGQTAYLVAFGVGFTLMLAIPLVGLLNVTIIIALFVASGFWMVIEYVQRLHLARKRDKESAEALAKEALHDDEASTR